MAATTMGHPSASAPSPALSPSPATAPAKKTKLPPTLALTAGAASGAASLFLLQPLDVLKTRLQQVSVEPGQKGVLSQTVRAITSSPHGVLSLWRGTLPTLLRNVPGAALYFASLNEVRSALRAALPGSPATVDLVGGGVARAAVGFILMPATVLKVRYESSLYAYGSVWGATREIFRTEGMRGLFAGFGATAIRDAPQAGLHVLIYEQTRRFLTRPTTPTAERALPSTLVNIAAALTGGILSTLLTQPFDTVKTLIQLQPRVYTNTAQALTKVWQDEGVRGYFKGGGVRVARKALSQAVTWVVYEEVVKWGKRRGEW